MKYPVFLICIMILFCSPLSACASKNNACDQAANKIKKEVWTGKQSQDSIDNAIAMCLLPAAEGNVTAQYNLSILYTLKNNNQENEKTYEWALKAAKNGHPYSQFHIGTMYERGIVVERNHIKATEWYEKAAQNGFSLAKKKLEERKEVTN